MSNGVRVGSNVSGITYVGDHALPYMGKFQGTAMQRFVSASEGGDRPLARRHNNFHVAIHEGDGGYLSVASYNLGLQNPHGDDGAPNPHQGYLVLDARVAKGLGEALTDCAHMVEGLHKGVAAATSHLSEADLESLRRGIIWHERETLLLEMGRLARVA